MLSEEETMQEWARSLDMAGNLPPSSHLGWEEQATPVLIQAKTLARNRADWSPFTQGELLAARSTLKPMSAPGEDGMTYEPFKASVPYWDEAILTLCNLCLHWGKVPSAWKPVW